ncbi:MAG: glycosyltransferase family 4 protein [Gemmatimonadota bacterium]|nr:glycosyltransferase family 4 protein [Gemmatimonadota bacterium]
MPTTFYPPYHFGGDAIAVQRLSRALVRAGHEVTVVHDVDAYRALGGDMPSTNEVDDDQGVHVIRLESRAPKISALLTQQTGRPVVHARKLRQLLGSGRFDVVNFHNASLIGGPGLLHMAPDCVRLYMAHEHWLVCPTHTLWRYRRELCTGKRCLRCQLAYRRPPQLWRNTGAMHRALRGVDTFIAMSSFSRDKHHEFGFPFPMEVLPAFLPAGDSDVIAPPSPRPHSRPYFFFAGRLERIKGLGELIACSADYPDADVLVAGRGDHESELRRLAADNPRVIFLGQLSVDALRAYYEHAIAFVMPSVCFETFGLGLIESFREGTPVIARRLGPFPEIVERAEAGLLFSTNTELRDAMRQLQGDPAMRERLSRAARVAFVAHWTDTVVLPAYLEIVERATVRANARRGTIAAAQDVA